MEAHAHRPAGTDPRAEVGGLALRPFRALRPTASAEALARLLCPPYDVIDGRQRAALLERDPDNAVSVILPQAADGLDPYAAAAARLDRWVAEGRCATDADRALYVYEMADGAGTTTRGLLGAVELRDPAAGVILPHENTMAGPVSDRLALMSATEADLEPIYLVYDGGGAASHLVRDAHERPRLAAATTPDGITHTLWAVPEPDLHAEVARDLAQRHALIADGHHRYATYRRLQQRLRAERGAGPWDRGLTLLVDSSSYGPQVHAIHRVLRSVGVGAVIERATQWGAEIADAIGVDEALSRADGEAGFAAVLTDGGRTALLTDRSGRLRAAARRPDEPAALAELDVTVLHRGLVERTLGLRDTVELVGYAHTVDEALAAARESDGTAVLLRPTPVSAVAAIAAAGARMPRKSTLFTPKPASGLVMRRFADDAAG